MMESSTAGVEIDAGQTQVNRLDAMQQASK